MRPSLPPAISAVQSRIIRLPASVHDFLNSVRKYTIELTVDGKLPTDEELGDKLGATVEKIQVFFSWVFSLILLKMYER